MWNGCQNFRIKKQKYRDILQAKFCNIKCNSIPLFIGLSYRTTDGRTDEESYLSIPKGLKSFYTIKYEHISKEDVPTWCKQFYYDFIS